MKYWKKLLSAVLAGVLLAGMTALSGCQEGGSGKHERADAFCLHLTASFLRCPAGLPEIATISIPRDIMVSNAPLPESVSTVSPLSRALYYNATGRTVLLPA